MIFTMFSDKRGLDAHAQDATAEELAEFIKTTTRDVRDKLPLIKFALFGKKRSDKGCLRYDENVTEITGIEADYDGGAASIEEAAEIVRQVGLDCVIYSSPSYTVQKPRWRVLCPLSTAYRPADRDRFMARLAGLYAQHGIVFDPASWALSQSYFVGTANEFAPIVVIIPGEPIDRLEALDDIAIGRPNGLNGAGNGAEGEFDERALMEAIISGANYHRSSLSLLGSWASCGIGMLEARERLVTAFECVIPPDRDARWHDRYGEIDELLGYVYGKEANKRDDEVEFTIGGTTASQAADEAPEQASSVSVAPVEEWPEPLGLAGEVVMAIEPHTEADVAAILFQFLTAIGNALGRRAYFLVEDTRHYPNLFVVLVGKTAKARKGTSWGRVRQLFEGSGWVLHCITEGLSTGEGLIHRVRDQVIERKQDKGGVHDVVVDPGVDDKRLLAFGEEYARILRAMQRHGNTLSQILREAWDGKRLEVATKSAPEKATGAHVSVISHVTRDDLFAEMDETMTANGFGNRFLYCCVRRSKLLPLGGPINGRIAAGLAARIKAVVDDCPSGEIPFDAAAEELWRARYEHLTADRLGMYGAITARGEAQTVRLALIYALLDRAQFIGSVHLEAALEVWRYADASARCVFGDRVGDRIADAILSALRRAGPQGMTRTEINNLWNGRVVADRINAALARLTAHGLAQSAKRMTGGRPEERWHV